MSNHKKQLISLTKTVAQFIAALDRVMKEESTVERGKKIAKLNNALELENDKAMYFGLGYGWRKIGNIKKR